MAQRKKMSKDELQALKNEYKESKKRKCDTLHVVWRLILNEYSLDHFEQFYEWGEECRWNMNTLKATNGAVASMNILLRKMAALGSIVDPDFIVGSENPWNDPIAHIVETVFNEMKSRMAWTPEMRRCFFASLMCGAGVIKTGLSSKYVYGETAWSDDIPKGASEGGLPELDEMLGYGPTTEFQNSSIRDEAPNIQWVPSTDIFHNPGVRRMDDIARTYHRQRRRLVDVVRDARYTKEFREQVRVLPQKEVITDDGYFLQDNIGPFFEDSAYTEVIECFDHSSREFSVFHEAVDVPAREWTDFTLPIDNPYHYLVPIEHPEFLWGIPYGLVILAQVYGKNQLRATLIDKLDRDGKTVNFVDTEKVPSDDFVDKINNAYDGQIIAFPGMSQYPVGQVFQQLKQGTAQAQLIQLMSIIDGDLAEVSGLTDAARNTATQNDQTATEVNQRSMQQGLTVEDFIQREEEFQEGVAADVCQIVLSEWDEKKVIKITGPMPELFFYVKVERYRVQQSPFTLTIVRGSTLRLDKATLRRQWNEMLNILMPLIDRANQDMAQQMQGMPASIVNYPAVIEATIDLYDPTLSRKLLNQRNTPQLLMRLMSEHNMMPTNISPQMAQMARSVAMMQLGMAGPQGAPAPATGAQPANVAPFPGQAPPPASAVPQQMGGPMPQNLAGNMSGRALSEGAMV